MFLPFATPRTSPRRPFPSTHHRLCRTRSTTTNNFSRCLRVPKRKKILDEETRKISPNQSITAELLIFRVHDIFIISCTDTSTEQIHRTRRRGAIGCDGFKWSCIGFKMDLDSTRGPSQSITFPCFFFIYLFSIVIFGVFFDSSSQFGGFQTLQKAFDEILSIISP